MLKFLLRKTLTQVLAKILNGRYTTIAISAVLHLLVFIALIYLSAQQKERLKHDIPEPQVAVKSYLYHAPKVIPKATPKEIKPPLKEPVNQDKLKAENIEEVVLKKVAPDKISPVKAKPSPQALQKALAAKPEAVVIEPKDKEIEQKTAKEQLVAAPPLPTSPPKKIAPQLSPHERLSRLRSAINNSVVNDAFKEYRQVRSASVMDGEQIPVPHSSKQLSREEIHTKNTVKLGHHAITKNDNGTCTIHREQMIGSPVEATTSYFGCGESKFDKSFREHMNKVRDKLKPKR